MKKTWIICLMACCHAAACSTSQAPVEVEIAYHAVGVDLVSGQLMRSDMTVHLERAQLVLTALELQRCSQPATAAYSSSRLAAEPRGLPVHRAHHTQAAAPTRLQATRILDPFADRQAEMVDRLQPPATAYCTVTLTIMPIDGSIDDVPSDSPLRGFSLRFAGEIAATMAEPTPLALDVAQAHTAEVPLSPPLQLSADARKARLLVQTAVDRWLEPADLALTEDPATLAARLFNRAVQSLQIEATALP